MSRRLRLASVAMLLGACGGAALAPDTAGTRPDDMSAADHRRAALEHERRARTMNASAQVRFGFPMMSSLYEDATYAENAVGEGIDVDRIAGDARASQELELARMHREAAAELERARDEACAGVADRDECPFERAPASVEEVDGGVHLRLRMSVDPEELEQRARCHMAVAREQHYESAHVCPLFLADALVEVDADGGGVTIIAPNAATAAAIRRTSRQLEH